MKSNSTRLVSLVLSRLGLTVLLILGQLALVPRAAAQVPERFSFQGYMEDGNSQPLGATTPVNYAVVFRIFPVASGGNAVWAERQIVTFDKGNYSVILGQGSANGSEPHGDLSAAVISATSSELYVQTTVTINGSDATVLPRLRLLPATYSFLAKKALTVDGAGISTGTIADDRLSLGLRSYITNGPIADSRLSSSLLNTINNGPIADSRLSPTLLNSITNGPIADSRISFALRNAITNAPVPDASLSVNVARRNAANTFTGNQTINSGKLTVNGDATISGNLQFGNAGQYSPALSVSNAMHIVAGRLPALANNGDTSATASGPGWSAVRYPSSLNFWRVTFNPTFLSPPAIVTTWGMSLTTPMSGTSDPGIITHNGGTSFIVYGATVGGGGQPLETHFMAIGTR